MCLTLPHGSHDSREPALTRVAQIVFCFEARRVPLFLTSEKATASTFHLEGLTRRHELKQTDISDCYIIMFDFVVQVSLRILAAVLFLPLPVLVCSFDTP